MNPRGIINLNRPHVALFSCKQLVQAGRELNPHSLEAEYEHIGLRQFLDPSRKSPPAIEGLEAPNLCCLLEGFVVRRKQVKGKVSLVNLARHSAWALTEHLCEHETLNRRTIPTSKIWMSRIEMESDLHVFNYVEQPRCFSLRCSV